MNIGHLEWLSYFILTESIALLFYGILWDNTYEGLSYVIILWEYWTI